MNRLTNCRLLQKNFEECVQQAQLDQEPASRVRHNSLQTPTPEVPKLTDLGKLTKSSGFYAKNRQNIFETFPSPVCPKDYWKFFYAFFVILVVLSVRLIVVNSRAYI